MRKAFDEVLEATESEMSERDEVLTGNGRPLELAADGRTRVAAQAAMEEQQEVSSDIIPVFGPFNDVCDGRLWRRRARVTSSWRWGVSTEPISTAP